MRIKILIILAVLVSGSAFSHAYAQEKVITMESLLNEMVNRDQLAQWPSAQYVCKQASSYSRASVTPNGEDGKYIEKNGRDWGKGWFENHDFGNFIRTDEIQGRKEDVLLDVDGPGAIVRWWHTLGGRANMGGIYRVYVDGNEVPVIEMYIKNLVGGNGLVGFPYSFNAPAKTENDNWRGQNLILPITFQNGCKITFDGFQKYREGWPGFYYQINYRLYEAGTKVKSYTKDWAYNNKKLLKSIGDELLKSSNFSEDQDHERYSNLLVKAGESFNTTIKGEKAIEYLSMKLKAEDMDQALRSTVLKIEFDNNETVWCPVGQFYGLGYKLNAAKTRYIETDTKGNLQASWIMPFKKKAKVSIVNFGDQEVKIADLKIQTKEWQWNDQSMYFHATWKERRNVDTKFRVDENYVSVKGKGVYVGDNLTIFNTHPDWWGEGDEKIFVDGEDFPSHFGTGTEDYYSYAWCRPQVYSYPFLSQPTGGGNKTIGMSSNNRYRGLDAIPFIESIDFFMEIWHPFRAHLNYSPATFFYAVPESSCNIKADEEGVKLKVAQTKDDVLRSK
ncbi:DUF2961 domain-containing protein [Puteibacter caeruleilacunae]|nr:DUF2961 domain-containing protein [Puteibacter caeruleilacunae]